MAVDTYYFDGSDAGATDPNGVWLDDSNAFNGNEASASSVSHPNNGSVSSNYLMAEGTNAPASGGVISQVRARVRVNGEDLGGSGNASIYTNSLSELLGTAGRIATTTTTWSDYVILDTPTGGWSWNVLQSLEVKCFASGMTSGDDSVLIYEIEIEVTSEETTAYTSPFPAFRA